MQQGRMTLDADHNEQMGILLHYMRTLTDGFQEDEKVNCGACR